MGIYKEYKNINIPFGFKELEHESIMDGWYYISGKGDIYSRITKKYLHPEKNKDGYLSVILRDKKHNPRRWTIHSLVALAYIGRPPADMKSPSIDHINNIRDDNRAENLCYMEHSENSASREKTAKGESNGRSKLTEDDIKNIREQINKKEISLRGIGRMFGVSDSVIRDIRDRKLWKHLAFSC